MELWFIAAWYALVSLVTAALYGHDKRRARRGGRRIPELRLHLAELLGGWPGAILARRVLRHKTRSTRFLLRSWAIILLHIIAWTLFMYR